MQNQMNLLKDLQEIDQEICAIEATQQDYRNELAGFEADTTRVQGMVDQLSDEIAVLQQSEGELQQDLLKEKDNVVRVEGRLPEIQTQKEYVAVLKEIETAKKSNKEIEDQVQAKKLEVGTLEADLEEKDTELAAISEKADARGAELTKLLAESETVLLKRTKTREAVAAELPVTLLRKYQNLFKRRAGLALALATRGACMGCNMQLPPQQYNRLLQVAEIQSCPHCNRILFVETEV